MSNKQQGFSLIEILVALGLIALVISTFTTSSGMFSNRQKLDESLDSIRRAIRFSQDEAALKNKIVRIRFLLDKRPQEFAVEFGPSDNFVIPKSIVGQAEVSSLKEQEELEAEKKSIDKKFSKVDEFQEDNYEFSEKVRIISYGSTLFKSLVSEGDVSMYFYPSGEKDSALIFLATDEELSSLSIPSFTMDFETEYMVNSEEVSGSLDELIEIYTDKAKGIFEKWLKE
ncbi:type II secretion system protein [Bacteriovoracaceae bacterium]|nr:type II secretion system protein [Bacteriovoracaceae bacterium]